MWAGSQNTTVYCRGQVPSTKTNQNWMIFVCSLSLNLGYCSIYSQANCGPTEYCDTTQNLCVCVPPYSGDTCTTIGKTNLNLSFHFMYLSLLKYSVETANVTSISPLYGLEQVAITVTVMGSNFLINCSCYLNGTAIPTTFISVSELQCQIPGNVAGIYSLTVRMLSNGPDSTPIDFEFYRKLPFFFIFSGKTRVAGVAPFENS